MKKGVWVGGLVLSLGGWASDLLAQDGPWRPATSGPVPITLGAAELKPCPAAVLGRPVAVTDDAQVERIFRPPSHSGLLPIAYHPPHVPAGLVPPTAKEIPGGERLPTWADVYEPGKKKRKTDAPEFAAARLGSPVSQPATVDVQRTAFTTFPASAPVLPVTQAVPPAMSQVPPMPTMRPFNADGPGNPYPYPTYAAGVPSSGMYGGGSPEWEAPSLRFTATAEYLLWWTKQDSVPALVTTSTDGGFGFEGQPGTGVLFGGGALDRDPRSGFRGSAGLWLDSTGEWAVEAGGFFLAQRSTQFGLGSEQNAVIARPFFNANAGTEFASLVAYPAISTGRIRIEAPSNVWGIDANVRCNVWPSSDYRFDLLAGFRYLDLDESLHIREEVNGLAGAEPPFTNARTTVFDRFSVQNQFSGGQIGFTSEWKSDPWSFELRGKLALGGTRQHLTIEGNETIVDAAGVSRRFPGGLLAVPGNIGTYRRTSFSVVPEIGATLGYQVTEHIRLYAGYNFLYWTNVARPGEQIDRNLDVTRIPNFNNRSAAPLGRPAPAVAFKQSDYWAHGIMVGVEFRY